MISTTTLIPLDRLKPGESGIIRHIDGTGLHRRRLLELGLTPRTQIFMRKTAPLGDPLELCLRGFELVLRKEEANQIYIEPDETIFHT